VAISTAIKRPVPEADLLLPYNAKVKDACRCTSGPHLSPWPGASLNKQKDKFVSNFTQC
jgi:hypothetical protein